jgi:hypothetical protein
VNGHQLHVVFGSGPVDHAVAGRLAGPGQALRAVPRHRPPGLADKIGWRAADATDSDAVSDAANCAAVVYQCLNAPYTQSPQRFPPLQRGVLTVAEHASALLVSRENGHGPAGGKPKTSRWPPRQDFFGPGITELSLGEPVLARAMAGKSAGFPYQSTFGPAGPPLAAVIAMTVAWYRTQARTRR